MHQTYLNINLNLAKFVTCEFYNQNLIWLNLVWVETCLLVHLL